MESNHGSGPVKQGQGRYWRKRSLPPDILYHATTEARLQHLKKRGVIEHQRGTAVYLSRTEGHAWQVAHRLLGRPFVLYIDVPRARKGGVEFSRNRHGLWEAPSIPVRYVLNLRRGFAEQVSAGGIPCYFAPDGPKLALIQVQRSQSLTWEVAKGKLELGETPIQAAIREVGEEMGSTMELSMLHSLGAVRFGFFIPEGDARLKTLHLFLLRTEEMQLHFEPAEKEGIHQVKWFDAQSASQVVSHRSLKPIFRQVKSILSGY